MPEGDVTSVREFNRYYTSVLGLLREGLLDTPYSLTEARIIFELARQDEVEVAAMRRWLDLDRQTGWCASPAPRRTPVARSSP